MNRKEKLLFAMVVLGSLTYAAWAANDTIGVTVGSGKVANLIKFATNVISETGICDATTENQCAAVSAGGALSIAGAAGSYVSGSIPDIAAAGLTDGASCASGTSLVACTRQIDADVKGPVAAGTARIGYTSDDVCTQKAKTNLPISQNGTSSVQLIALSGSTVIYVCSLSLVAAGATTVAITTGTGTACVTGNAAVIGSTTANIANSMSFAANGGLTLGSGTGTIAQGAASSELCMILGTNVFVSGNLTYVQQ